MVSRNGKGMIMIRLEPQWELANRLRAIDSALILTRDIQESLDLIWRHDETFNCDFGRLMEIPDGVSSLRQIHMKPPTNSRVVKRICKIRQSFLSVFHRAAGWRIMGSKEVRALVESQYDFRQLKGQHVWVSSGYRFVPNPDPYR